MKIINILVAEDEKDQLELYNDAIDEFNKENQDIIIKPTIAKNKETALNFIKDVYFDAAFIDLNLSKDKKGEGKELINSIQENARYPIYVVSGNIHEIEHEFDNNFISKHDKADGNTDKLLLEIKKIYETGLTNVLGSKGIIEKHFNSIFWNHFSKSKDYWDTHEHLSGEELEKVISRYTLTHLLEYFQIEHTTGEEIDSYDPSEMYIKPHINQSFNPGSIVIHEDAKYLVLTPACTISQDNCDCLTLLKLNALLEIEEIVDLKEELNTLKSTAESLIQSNSENIEKFLDHDIDHGIYSSLKENNTSEKFCAYYQSVKNELDKLPCKKVVSKLEENCKQIKANDKAFLQKEKAVTSLIKKYIKNNVSDRFYFLAEFLDFKAKVIDFQDIKTLDFSEVGNLEKIMDITTPFLKDVQEKFSSYYARQGAPDFDSDSISSQYTRKLLNS